MILLIKRERKKERERMNENQSVSVVQRKRCKHEKKKKRRNNIFLSRGAKMCAPSGASPPLPIVSKNSPPPLVTTNPNLINTKERKRDLNLSHHLTSNSSIFVQ
jgi:hypothetical protein